LAGNVCAAESPGTEHIYLLASAFFVASLYSFYVGDIPNARIVLGVAVVLAGARFFLGPQDEASVPRKIALGIGIFILIVAVTYSIRAFFG
jgi:drug/metabolite transporter (DMT)-like permease